MTRKLVEIPGLRLKFRTSADGEWLTATVWSGELALKEIARLHTSVAAEPEGEVYQAWVDAIGKAFCGLVQEGAPPGVAKVEALRRKPDYKGE